ncbi:MAG: lipase family protein [Bacteroidales bacterium]|nr:lipase family protein [Bacteroidales bacterium]
MKLHQLCIVCLTAFASIANAQTLKPGFEISEFKECICMASHFRELPGVDSSYLAPRPTFFTKKYSSPVTAFDNMWELWQRSDGVVAISLRASVVTMKSWLCNFHAGMVGAQGECQIGGKRQYRLCDNAAARVHAGWLTATLSMTDDIEAHIDSCYKAGIHDFIIAGHSQGGAMAYLLTAFLREKQSLGEMPKDIRFKTYCSGAPKPGDYAFACEYEYMTRDGWAFNVVSPEDWVPEVPLSVQRTNDFRPTNPFTRIDELTDTLSFGNRLKMRFLFKLVSKHPKKAEKRLRKYLGKKVGKMLEKENNTYKLPTFAECANYARVGQTVILKPDASYYERHQRNAKDIFEHHAYKQYFELAEKY